MRRILTVLCAFGAACTPTDVPGDATMGDGGRWAQAGAVDPAFRATTVCPPGAITPGIDVSYWQGTIDWASVATDVDYAFIRVSDGLNYYDTEFSTNWANAKSNGVLRGAYQFYRPGLDPIAQADLLLDSMGPLEPGDLPPVIDVETSDGQSATTIINGIQDWIDRVEGELGVKPLIYTSWGLWGTLTGDTAQFAGYPLWVANWGVSCPSVPDVWGDWEVWQHTDSGSVPGISGNVDENWFNGDYGQLLDFAVDGDPPPPCDPIPAEGRTVEENEPCFLDGGSPQYWHDIADGSAGALIYTHATDFADVENYGVWTLDVEVDGVYLLEVHTAAPHAESTQASYQVADAVGTSVVVIDQTAFDGWQVLGEFPIDADTDGFVRLDDNTGEPWNSGETQLVYDAIRVTPVDSGTTPGDPPTTGDPPTDDPPGTQVDPPGSSLAPRQVAPTERGGCGCTTTGGSWGAGLVLALLALGRRRS